jgi:LacI family transcriptional regulator, xylobiose transport system transcriptional regulator
VDRATIASIAEQAGVSVPTVSRVLNERADVAPATRSRVEAVISQRGYRRRGATSAAPSPVIDVVFPELDGAWAVEVMRGVTRVAREEGLMVNLTESASGNVPGQGWVDAFLARRATGVILVVFDITDQQHRQLSSGASRSWCSTPPASPPRGCRPSGRPTGTAAWRWRATCCSSATAGSA